MTPHDRFAAASHQFDLRSALEELLAHAESSLGIRAGGTSADGAITLEEACRRLAFVRSIFLGAASERRLPAAPLMNVAKGSISLPGNFLGQGG